MKITEESRDFMIEFFKENAPNIDAEKQFKAALVASKPEKELTPEDRQYYGAPEFRGYESANKDGSITFNTGGTAIEFDFELDARERNDTEYRKFCQDMFFRKFMGYDIPYFREPKEERLVAIYNQVAVEMGFPQDCMVVKSQKQLPDVKMSAEASNEAAEAAKQHPVDDAEQIAIISNFVSYCIDRIAPAIAEGIDDKKSTEILNSDEFKKVIDESKCAVISLINESELDLKGLWDSLIDLIAKNSDDAHISIAKAFDPNEILQKLDQQGDFADISNSIKSAIMTLINGLNEKPLINAIADIVVKANSIASGNDKYSDAKELSKNLSREYAADIREIASMFRKEHAEDIQAATSVDVEVLDKSGNVVSKEKAVTTTDKAKSDNKTKTASEKREEKRKKQETVEEDGEDSPTYTETDHNGNVIIVDEDRYNGFAIANRDAIKQYPGLQDFIDLLRDDQKVKFNNYYGLISASIYTLGVEKEMQTLYIDPGKIRPGYSVIIPRSGSNIGLDPLTDVSCTFANAKRLIQTGVYGEQDFQRDNATTVVNMSFFEHICYNKIPEIDLPYVIGKLLILTNTLSSMGLCLRFKPVNYKSRDVFTLACNKKVSLSRFAKHNHQYDGLEIDVHIGNNDIIMFRAHGKHAKEFAGRVNKFTNLPMIDLEISDKEFEEADRKVAERVKVFSNKVVNS